MKSLSQYREYLNMNINSPCMVTGIEDFPWEEKYVLGYGDKTEYEKLKKKQPSYNDTFEFMDFEDEIDKDTGILVRVRRMSDKKRFILDLASLKAADETSKNYVLLDDYNVWFVNY
jgi:hypothetical protein